MHARACTCKHILLADTCMHVHVHVQCHAYNHMHIIAVHFHTLQNPDYMKDGFHITIETIHVPNDVGKQENVSPSHVHMECMTIWFVCSIYKLDIVKGLSSRHSLISPWYI